MYVLKYVCFKICLFFNKKIKNKQKITAADLGTDAARSVGRRRFFLFVNYIFVKNKHKIILPREPHMSMIS